MYARTSEIARLANVTLSTSRTVVLISETKRISEADDHVLGVWEATGHRIVVHRDQLNGLAGYAGTLLREIGHRPAGP